MECEDREALFNSYPCPYFVQSPSTISHSNSADHRNTESAFHSPIRSEIPSTITTNQQLSRFTLSRYSSRGSNNSVTFHEKKVIYDLRNLGIGTDLNGEKRLIVVDRGDGDDCDGEETDAEEEYYGRDRGGLWQRYFSYRRSNSCLWISLQIWWRILVSLGIAVLVFYIATKPPPPEMYIKIAGIPEFELGEGVDGSGVSTKILTCNCSMELYIDNKSKLFGLHIQPPSMEMLFGHLPFAFSHGQKLYAKSYGSTLFELNIGTKNKPMYGAGRSMEDMLESGKGLALLIRVNLSSSFRVIWKFINPNFHHQGECLLVLDNAYDKKHETQAFKSSCTISPHWY